MSEEWRDVPGWEGLYAVSSLGRVRSEDRVINKRGTPGGRGPYTTRSRGRILRPYPIGTGGYLSIVLAWEGARTVSFVHRLVAAAFIGPLPAGLQVNHIDGDRVNNRPGNLEYVTARENIHHSWRLGMSTARLGEQCSHAVLTEDLVRYIRRMEGTMSRKELARECSVTPKHIWQIQKRKRWAHLE